MGSRRARDRVRAEPRDEGTWLRREPGGRADAVLDDPSLPLDNTRSERALRKIVVGRKSWLFYGSDTHAEAAAAIFSVVASCRLHAIDPYQYIEEILRVLPYWPRDRYLELAPKFWKATRGRLRPEELDAPLSAFEVPPPLDLASPTPSA